MSSRRVFLGLAWLGLLGATSPVAGQSSTSVVTGVVRDAHTEEPVPWVDVRLSAAGVSRLSDGDGVFRIVAIPAGRDTLVTSRLGYDDARVPIEAVAGDTLHVVVQVYSQSLLMPEIQVSGAQAEEDELSHGDQTPVALSGRDLRERLGSTIAATLADETGIAEESMGPAPARPVVRGLSGNRLLLLDDGVPTGDLSASSADHAVAIDPLGAQRLEVIRGPATLLYGSAVQGGLINVQRDYVLDDRPGGWSGTAGFLGDSVNEGGAAQARVRGPIGPFAFTASGTYRGTKDIDTPLGTLGNSSITTWNATAGMSATGDWGYAGLSGRRYESDYGIPGGFLGGHPNGADIELEQTGLDARASLLTVPGVEELEFRGRYSRYFHRELESNGVCGVSFGLLEYHGATRARLHSGPLGHTTFGVSTDIRDYAQGCLAFVPQTDELSFAGFVYHESVLGRFDLHGGARFDNRLVRPSEERSNKAGEVRDRDFSGVSAAASAATSLGAGFATRLTLTRSFRAPSLEELFSDGPHLASFAYEVGNTELGSEIGHGIEWNLRWDGDRTAAWLSLFHNDYDRFIHVADTGELEFGPGESGFLSRWQYRGQAAALTGAEFETGWKPRRWLELSAAASYVRGQLTDLEQPLPRIPPLSGRLGAKLHLGDWHAGLLLRGASEQSRLAEFEEFTAGYVTADLSLEWSRLVGGSYQTVLLRVQNLADAEYRNHLSRIKSIMPQPGRNISLLYRVELF